MRKVKVPFMGRRIGTFGHVAKVAHEALIDYFPVIFFVDAVDFHGRAFINEVEQGGERAAQADTATATVADVKNSF
jgi:hypothetical protein